MEESELVMATSGISGPALVRNYEIRKSDDSPSLVNMNLKKILTLVNVLLHSKYESLK